jgi:serine/threonine protein phosphatase 1
MGIFDRLKVQLGGRSGPRGKEGARAYAVGDIHGRLDLLDLLIEKIERDIAARPRARNFVIFLGDYIDRGPDSCGVIERLRLWQPERARVVYLGGNHEEVLLRVLRGDEDILPSWLKFGGAECVESYGLDPDSLRQIDPAAAIELIRAKVPRAHRAFLEDLADTFRFGDYLFVHAGIRPGLGLEEQDRYDLRWIREPFLSDIKEHGFMVVHGHTIVSGVEERPNRIAIDTGAYHSGVLTALAVEGSERWYLATSRDELEMSESAVHLRQRVGDRQ